MASEKLLLILFLFSFNQVKSESLFDRSYQYVVNFGKSLVPNVLTIFDCMEENDIWGCLRSKGLNMLNSWDGELEKQRRSWQDEADAEIRQSGRSIGEMPSKLGKDVEESLNSVTEMIKSGLARAMSRHHDSGGIDTITLTAAADNKKKKEKKKKKPSKLHVIHMPMMTEQKAEDPKGLDDSSHESVYEAEFVESISRIAKLNNSRTARNMIEDAWSYGEKALDAMAEHAMNMENKEDGIEHDKSSLDEQRGKKKKKKKAILKLLLLGAVLKAKIGTLLQILSFKLQVKFFIIALLGLAINLARFWVDLKKQHHPPQKVIYYEHAQHQHHYDHEEEGWGGGGGWNRNLEEENEETDIQNSPYRAHEGAQNYIRPVLTRV